MKYVLASLLMAGGANAKPAQITQIKVLMLVSSLLALCGIGGAVWAMVAGRPLTGAWIGAVPGVFCVIVVIVMIKTEW
jgi:hypothetical protein